MYYVLGESAETGEFEVWESLSAKEAMAVRNEYIKMGLQTRSGKMSEIQKKTGQVEMLKWIKQQWKELAANLSMFLASLVDAYVEGRDEMEKKVAGKDYKPRKKRKK